MKDITIRTALLTDKTVLLALEQKVVEAELPYNETIKTQNARYYDIDNLLISDDTKLIVAQYNKEIIGTGYVQIRPSKKSLQHTHHGYLGFMYVAPEFRGLGINKKIMEALTLWAKSRNINDFYLDVYHQNSAAIKAYEKVGFTPSLVEMKLNCQ